MNLTEFASTRTAASLLYAEREFMTRSGSSTQRLVRSGLTTILVIGFAGMYLWDGFGGYARKNVEEFLASQGLPTSPLPVIDPQLTSAVAGEKIAVIRRTPRMTPDEVKSSLGAPALTKESDWYYFGPGGRIKVRSEPGSDVTAEWQPAGKTETDILWQQYIAYVLCVAGIVLAIRLVSVLTFSVAVDEQGLRIKNRPAIGFANIKRVDARDFAATGRVDFHYQEGTTTSVLRLDDYVVKHLREIVGAVCEKANLENPLEDKGDHSSRDASAMHTSRTT